MGGPHEDQCQFLAQFFGTPCDEFFEIHDATLRDAEARRCQSTGRRTAAIITNV
jgi:hypothetical protein